MDPFAATIIKQSGAIALGFAAAGILAALLFGLYSYVQLQHALTLNLVPPSLPSANSRRQPWHAPAMAAPAEIGLSSAV
jgi:hypothetical protein